jgi:hypothetical protein
VQFSRALRLFSMPETAHIPYQTNGLGQLPDLFLIALPIRGKRLRWIGGSKRKRSLGLRGNVEEIDGPRWSSECSYLRQNPVM